MVLRFEIVFTLLTKIAVIWALGYTQYSFSEAFEIENPSELGTVSGARRAHAIAAVRRTADGTEDGYLIYSSNTFSTRDMFFIGVSELGIEAGDAPMAIGGIGMVITLAHPWINSVRYGRTFFVSGPDPLDFFRNRNVYRLDIGRNNRLNLRSIMLGFSQQTENHLVSVESVEFTSPRDLQTGSPWRSNPVTEMTAVVRDGNGSEKSISLGALKTQSLCARAYEALRKYTVLPDAELTLPFR